MNLMSKGVLTAMTLALDFAAGAAIDTVWDATWTLGAAQRIASPQQQSLPASITSFGNSLTVRDKEKSGGVCRPAEISVMVMEIGAMGPGRNVTPKQVCIRAMSGEPDFAKAFDLQSRLPQQQ